MSEVTLFAIGFVLFIATTWATLAFGYGQFQEWYRADQAVATSRPATPGGTATPAN